MENFTLSEGEKDGDRDDVRLAYEITAGQLKLPEAAADSTPGVQGGVEVGIRVTNSRDVLLMVWALASTITRPT